MTALGSLRRHMPELIAYLLAIFVVVTMLNVALSGLTLALAALSAAKWVIPAAIGALFMVMVVYPRRTSARGQEPSQR